MDRHIQPMRERHSRNDKGENRRQLHVLRECYGLSRTRDAKGNIVKRNLMDCVNCVQASIGGGTESRQVLVVEVYEDTELCDARQE